MPGAGRAGIPSRWPSATVAMCRPVARAAGRCGTAWPASRSPARQGIRPARRRWRHHSARAGHRQRANRLADPAYRRRCPTPYAFRRPSEPGARSSARVLRMPRRDPGRWRSGRSGPRPRRRRRPMHGWTTRRGGASALIRESRSDGADRRWASFASHAATTASWIAAFRSASVRDTRTGLLLASRTAVSRISFQRAGPGSAVHQAICVAVTSPAACGRHDLVQLAAVFGGPNGELAVPREPGRRLPSRTGCQSRAGLRLGRPGATKLVPTSASATATTQDDHGQPAPGAAGPSSRQHPVRRDAQDLVARDGAEVGGWFRHSTSRDASAVSARSEPEVELQGHPGQIAAAVQRDLRRACPAAGHRDPRARRLGAGPTQVDGEPVAVGRPVLEQDRANRPAG